MSGLLIVLAAISTAVAESDQATDSTSGTSSRGQTYALAFDGIDDIVKVLTTDALRFQGTNPWSLGFWVKLDHDDFWQPHLLGIRAGCGAPPFFQVISTQSDESMHVGSGGPAGGCGVSAYNLPHYETPTHFLWVVTGNSAALYMNGELVGSDLDCGPIQLSPGNLILGNVEHCGGHNTTGWFDDVWFRDRALTEEEVAETWDCSIPPDDPSLVGYWSFDEPIGTQEVYDLSSYGHHGVLGWTDAVEAADPSRFPSPLALCDSPPRLSGTVRVDPLADCGFTDPLAGWTIIATPVDAEGGVQQAEITGDAGSFSMSLVPGSWEIEAQAPGNYDLTCNSQVQQIEIATGEVRFLEFGALLPGGVRDLRVDLVSSPAPRPGFEYTYIASYQNTGSNPEDVVVEIDLPDATSFRSASPGFELVGSLIRWEIDALEPNDGGRVSVQVELSTTAPIRTNVNAWARILPEEEDIDPADNVSHDSAEIVGSFDPNDKLVFPEGFITPDGVLTYRLRFQNVGNASAINVTVRDTLTADLDLSTFTPIGASHDHTLTISGRELIWDFPGIELADSASNEPESHGFVEFEIRPVEGLLDGTDIQNRGGIYFDFNPVVLTNTVVNEVLDPSDVGPEQPRAERAFAITSMAPNPMRNGATIQLHLARSGRLDLAVYAVDGRRVVSIENGKRSEGNVVARWDGLDSSGTPVTAGIYFVRGRLETDEGVTKDSVPIVVLD